eukprot:PhM_4_TR5705/c0_g10_i1/m.94714
MRRTLPAVSFAPTHVNLMMRSSKPLLANEMDSYQRLAACWNDLPFSFTGNAKYEFCQWDDKCRYELGIRRIQHMTKAHWLGMNLLWFVGFLSFLEVGYLMPYMLFMNKGPDNLSRDNGPAYSKRVYGVDVWCADGKFIRPFFHMVPPMFTMTADEL